MFNIGWTEVVIVLGVALLIFGPKKIPELGNALGKTLRGFKQELKDDTADDRAQIEEESDSDVY